MGWGTFAAGQAVSMARSYSRRISKAISQSEDSTFFAELLEVLQTKFLESYIRRVLLKTVIMHPKIWDSVDMGHWENSITKRAGRDWQLLLLIQVAVLAIGATTFWPLLFLYVPGFWYFGKMQAIKIYSKEINKEFANEGFEVPVLFAEIPALLDDEKQADQENARRERKRAEEQESLKRFGKKKGDSLQ